LGELIALHRVELFSDFKMFLLLFTKKNKMGWVTCLLVVESNFRYVDGAVWAVHQEAAKFARFFEILWMVARSCTSS
jgi:hypothetical protein